MKALILAGLLLSTERGFAQDSRFLVAIKQEQLARSTAKNGWTVQIGEVYQFVRDMSASEYNGGAPGPDKSYVVAKIDDVEVSSRADHFVQVPDRDVPEAAMKYGEEVSKHQETEQRLEFPSPTPPADAGERTPPQVESAVQPGALVVAKRDCLNVRSNLPGMTVKAGGVFRFVRYMSNYEYLGSELPSNDRSNVVLKIGDVMVVAPTAGFARVSAEHQDRGAEIYAEELAAISKGRDEAERQREQVTQESQAEADAAAQKARINGIEDQMRRDEQQAQADQQQQQFDQRIEQDHQQQQIDQLQNQQ